jgi:hypothetical protein
MIFARFGDKKQTRRQNMAEIVFSLGVGEIKCIIFKENNDNPYEINNIYIELRLQDTLFGVLRKIATARSKSVRFSSNFHQMFASACKIW